MSNLDPHTARIALLCIFAAVSVCAICAGGLFETKRRKRRG